MIHHSSRKPSPSSSKLRRLDMPSKATVTPQRKHRKLLKDGSGSEVWPENVEKIFVAGLREYWESPWATYSRGRSRWRNQFLVDYLKKAGIERSKKQVASHIQVLRNMWKGEPEFHLVAGGEELFLETGLLAPVKLEEQCDPNSLISLSGDEDDNGSLGSPSESASGFPSEYRYGNHPSPSQPLSPIFDNYSPSRSLANFTPEPISPIHSLPFPPSPLGSGSPLPDYRATLRSNSCNESPLHTEYPHTYPQLTYPVTQKSHSLPHGHGDINHNALNTRSAPSSPFRTVDNRVTLLCLWAEGMSPLSLAVDHLASGSQFSPMTVQLKLHLSSIDDLRSPPTLHGFHGTVSIATPWISSAKCLTKVYTNNICVSMEADSLQLAPNSLPPGDPTVTAFLPESSLSRSRWLEANLQSSITQEIIIDGVTLALFVYHLDRSNVGLPPSAEVTAFQKYVAPKAPLTPSISATPLYPYITNYAPIQPMPMTQQYHRIDNTSLACALTPVKHRF